MPDPEAQSSSASDTHEHFHAHPERHAHSHSHADSYPQDIAHAHSSLATDELAFESFKTPDRATDRTPDRHRIAHLEVGDDARAPDPGR